MNTPENARLAAYQATRERLDFRRTAGQVKCKPPNRRCGDRCIPPSWDCRLKGEGNDGHLKAVGRGSDPVAGFANIERGFTRLRKGVVTLSFSELEGGRRSLARGAAKLTPGDLQKKKEIQDKVNQFAVTIGTPVAIAVFAGLAHRGAKAFPAYARGPGAKIDETASNVFRAVARNMPFTGPGTRAREAAGPNAARAAGRVFQTLQVYGPDNLSRQAGSRSTLQRNVSQIDILSVQRPLFNSLNSVDRIPGTNKRSNKPYTQWDKESMVAFFSTERTPSMSSVDELGKGSMFSILAANDALTRGLDIPRHKYTNSRNQSQVIVSTTADFLRNSGEAVRTSMKEYGLNPKSREAVEAYVERISPQMSGSGDYAVAMREKLINATINGDYQRQAKDLYKETVQGFDEFYNRVVDDIRNAPDISTSDRSRQSREALREAFANSYYRDAINAHAAYLHENIKLPERVYGTYTATLTKRIYHAKKVVGRERFNSDVAISLTRTEIFNAGREVAVAKNLPEPENVEAARQLLLQTYGSNNGSRLNGVGSIAVVQTQSPRRRTAPETTGQERSARRRAPGRAQIIKDLLKQRYYDKVSGTWKQQYTPESAAAEAERILAARRARRRTDAYLLVREDFTPTNKREGKPCGKSFIGKNEKCSKPGAKGYAQPAPGQNQSTGLLSNAAKVATIAGGAAAVVGAFRNRKKIRVAARKGDIKLRQALKRNNKQLYRTYARVRVQRRAAGSVVRQRTAEVVPEISKRVIKRLSSEDVTRGINKLPEQYRERASRLVGDAKLSAAHMALRARGAEMIGVDTENNFSNWRSKNGALLSTGSVGESLVIYNTTPQESLGGARTFSTQFRIDGEFDAKSSAAATNSKGIVSLVKKMFNSQIENLPDNSIIYAIPYANDSKGGKRSAIYRRYGFRQALSSDDRLFAMKTKGKFTKMKDSHIEQIADLIRNDALTLDSAFNNKAKVIRFDFTPTQERSGKPCGKSFIPKNQKCSKATTARYAEPNKEQNTTVNNVKVAAGTTAAAGAVALLAAIGVSRARVSRYRKNVSKSAIEAEKLALEFERKFREDAARRLNKRPQDVTGFEASVYNFKDKGRDGGFGSMDNDPAWFGQTKSSKGAVVMLSYADDNKFTTRGQGSYMMAKGGAFQQIWGDRDILPYSNNISQPTSKVPDDLQVRQREAFIARAEKVAGGVGKNAAKAGITIKDTFQRFEFLRENIEKRGFNPDAVRAAAFVVAQRRLTGKSVDIMSYSNGGNVATETLAILKEMGYRDVKVINVAGPTFGIFSHSEDNMRTWVSEGDDFYKISKGLAFQGGNTRILKNSNIPHGLTEKIDVNNREFGKDAKANYKAKNSYLLDEQLQREAYKFLNVDRKRSSELLDETIWRISENKPMEGDLAGLFGDQSATKMTEFSTRIKTARNRDSALSQIRDEIEDRMLEVWYGGYNAKNVKKAQNQIQAELKTQISPAPKTPTRPAASANTLATELMKQNPGMTRAAALKEARRRMAQRKTDSIAYFDAYKLTRERHLKVCA